jgi:hypothetical protein
MWADKKRKRPHEWLEGVLRVLGLAPSTHISYIIEKVIKGYDYKTIFEDYHNYNSIHYLYDAFHILKIITPGVKLRKFWGTVGYLGKDLRGTFPLKTI